MISGDEDKESKRNIARREWGHRGKIVVVSYLHDSCSARRTMYSVTKREIRSILSLY